MKVYIGLNGEGLGHYARAAALYQEAVDHGHQPILATYGVAYEKARHEGFDVIRVPPEVSMTGTRGRFDLLATMGSSLSLPLRLIRSVRYEKRMIRGFDVVVSDCRFSTALSGHLMDKPVFLMSNQTTAEIPVDYLPGVRGFRDRVSMRILLYLMELTSRSQYKYVDEILIGDLKPPYTISLPILSRDPKVKKKTVITGPINRLVYKRYKPLWPERRNERKPKLFITVGGQAYRLGLVPHILSTVKRMDATIVYSHFTVKHPETEGNIHLIPFSEKSYGYMSASDIIIQPAGHSGIMESILLGKPCLLIPDDMQPEQLSNARRYSELGFGEYITHNQLHDSKLFIEKLNRMLDHIDYYRKRLSQVSRTFGSVNNGPRNALDRIEDLYHRMYDW